MSYVGWFANLLILVGLWKMGVRVWWVFAFTAAGEALWVGAAFARGQYDLAAICVVFCVMAVRNLFLWKNGA